VIKTTYTISEAEFVEAQKVWCAKEARKLPGRSLVFGLSIVLGVCIGLSFTYLPIWLSTAFVLTLAAQIAASYWRKRALRSHAYAVNSKRMEEVRVQIDDAGYQDERPGLCGGWMKWDSFTGWQEAKSVFILGRNMTFVTIPKRGLESSQQDELRTLLTKYLGVGR